MMAFGKPTGSLLFALLILIKCTSCTLIPNTQGSTNFTINIELLDPGPEAQLSSNMQPYYLRLSGQNLASVFPTSLSSLTVKLSRDLLYNRKLAESLDFDVFMMNQNGAQVRVDADNKQTTSIFIGQILPPYSNSSATSPEVLAVGLINAKTRSVWLQAFINLGQTFLYIRPQITKSSSSSTSNVHIISSESVHFYNLFQMQFRKGAGSKRVHKRSADNTENRCPLIIYVDYSLFELMGHRHHRVIHFVHTVFTFANNIFLRTIWSKTGYPDEDDVENNIENSILKGYGHTLCKVVIQEQPPTRMDPLYNHDRSYWEYDHLITVLSNLPRRSSYCLAFLFTNLNIFSTDKNDMNGVAMQSALFSTRESVPNVGAATFHHCSDPLDLHCLLNFAHELGHSWGAFHDSHTHECIPPANGTYLMSNPFLFTRGSNNMLFSPCSNRAIFVNIQRIDQQVFKSFCAKCGNGRIEEPEECDEGDYDGHCCTKSCTLFPNAACSHFNFDCCNSHCQVSDAGTSCRRKDLFYCFEESHCNGVDTTCPLPQKLPEGTRCANDGTCQAGFCNATCPAHKDQCPCSEDFNQCLICCLSKRHSNGEPTCMPSIPLPAGTPCRINDTIFGRCIAGYCEEATIDSLPEDEGQETKSYGTIIVIIIFGLFGVFTLFIVGSYFVNKRFSEYLHKLIHLRSNSAELVDVELKSLNQPSTNEPNGSGLCPADGKSN